MRNLENFGVQEMSLSEQKSIDGGFLPLLIYGAALVVEVACYALAGDILLNFDEYTERLENAMNKC